jgi:hypothetical protein
VKELDVVDSKQECLQVKISGSNFEFSFAVNCDGGSANKNNNGGNVRSSSSDDAKSSSAAGEEDDIDLNAADDENEEL